MRHHTAGLGFSPFARRYWGNRVYFLFQQVLRCFSSPRSLPAFRRMTGSLPPGCPIRISAVLRVFAPRRSFSQLITSFFASESLGIPHAPFLLRFFFNGPKTFALVFVSFRLFALVFYSVSAFLSLSHMRQLDASILVNVLALV